MKRQLNGHLRRFARRAVTLIEVVFAIGVILIGLLGLLSILPLAGRRAQDAIDLNVGSVMGEQVLKDLQSRRYLSSGRLKRLREDTSDLTLTNIATLTANPDLNSFCIDPLFASSSVASAANENGYTRTWFPFFGLDHNPLLDPSTDSNSWPTAQPRMTRVGIYKTLPSDSTTTPPTPARDVFLSTSEALAIIENSDDLLVSRPDDRTRNATFQDSELTAIAGLLPYSARIPKGEFTWIATVNPMPGGVYASVSIVVMKKRERDFTLPDAPAANDQANAVSERLTYVTYASGFRGGAGGTIHLVSAGNTVPVIQSSDWVMLSRNVSGTAAGPVVHRWYRVVAVNNEPERFTTDGSATSDDSNLGARIPGGGNQVWRHKVLLEGPDWSFNYQIAGVNRQYADNTFADNTYATVVSDVVSVTERVMLLSDL
ncbi:hypothetical protein N9D23_07555 [Rubripirellula sp.]|nr:hypothetical protein [Rubripirellula sp.]